MTKENTFYLQDSYNVYLSKDQEEQIFQLFDIHDFTYNVCLDLALADDRSVNGINKPVKSINPIDPANKLMDYMYEEYISKPNRLYPYMYNANPLIVYGAIVNFLNNMNAWDNVVGMMKQKFFNKTIRTCSMVMNSRYNHPQISIPSQLTLKLPIIGEVSLIAPLNQFDVHNLQDTASDRIIKFDITYDKSISQYSVTIHKQTFFTTDNSLEIPNAIGIYLAKDDITTMSFSNGTRQEMPDYILTELLRRIKSKKKYLQTYIESRIIEWFRFTAHQLLTKYSTIYVENQPREVTYPLEGLSGFEVPSWLKFTAILNQLSKEYKNTQVINILKSSNTILTCNRCGTIYEQLPMIYDNSWGCRMCHTIHDKDINAAKNILKAGILSKERERPSPRPKNFNSVLHDCD